MRITKELAGKVAHLMTEEKNQKWRQLKKELATEIYDIIFDELPKNVSLFYTDNPQWVKSSSSVKLMGNGFN